MAQSATIYRFQLELADIDRGRYESLDLRVAQHPSEDNERVVVRVLARVIANEEGLEFARDLFNVEEPALWARSAIGEIETWIDIGIPSADRLHQASKAARRLLVFTDKPDALLRKEWSSRPVHGAKEIDVIRFPRAFVRELAASLERKVNWYVTIQDGQLSVSGGEHSADCAVTRSSLARFLEAED